MSARVCFPESHPAGLGLLGLSPGTGWRRCRLPRSEEKEARGASCAWKVSPGTLGRSVPALPAAPHLRGAGSRAAGGFAPLPSRRTPLPPLSPAPSPSPSPRSMLCLLRQKRRPGSGHAGRATWNTPRSPVSQVPAHLNGENCTIKKELPSHFSGMRRYMLTRTFGRLFL